MVTAVFKKIVWTYCGRVIVKLRGLKGSCSCRSRNGARARYQWLTSVILATRAAEQGGSKFEASQGKKFTRPPSQSIAGHCGAHLSFQATWKAEIRRINVPGQTGQKFVRPYLSGKKLDMVPYPCHPWNSGKHKIGGHGTSQPGQRVRPYLQNNQSKQDWGHGSSYRAPAYQAWIPMFKPQYRH
jgi:hypothetical protein